MPNNNGKKQTDFTEEELRSILDKWRVGTRGPIIITDALTEQFDGLGATTKADCSRLLRESLSKSIEEKSWKNSGKPGKSPSVVIPIYVKGIPTGIGIGIVHAKENNGYVAIFSKTLEAKSPRLEDFAYLGGDNELMRKLFYLAAIAQDEKWGDETSSDPRERYKLLLDYLNQTFRKLYAQDGIRVDDENSIMAFNTGLLTDSYADIYAIFLKNDSKKQKWRLDRFVSSDKLDWSESGMALKSKIGSDLPRALYFMTLEDAVYDASLPVPSFRRNHIVKERLGRFPAAYLAEKFGISIDEARELKEKATVWAKDEGEKDCVKRACSIYAPSKDPLHIFFDIDGDVERAIVEAHFRAKKNYTVAVPSYNPALDTMGFYLPLRLSYQGSNGSVDLVASVARKLRVNESKEDTYVYEVPTVLELETARLHFRLVLGQYDMWLAPDKPSEGEREERVKVKEDQDRKDREAVTARLVQLTTAKPVAMASLTYTGEKHDVWNGSTIGVLRYSDRKAPDLELPRTEGFMYASHDQGVFTHDGTCWHFTNHSGNGTRILRKGAWIALTEDPMPLEDGDELEFGNVTGMPIRETLERAVFHI